MKKYDVCITEILDKHVEWDYLESIAYEELLIEEERPIECTKIIDEIVDFLEKQWERKNKNV